MGSAKAKAKKDYSKEYVKAAEVGMKFVHTHDYWTGEKFDRGQRAEATVAAKCEDGKGGHWVCLTHGMSFANQFQKDTHIGPGKVCTLAWFCVTHGVPEVP